MGEVRDDVMRASSASEFAGDERLVEAQETLAAIRSDRIDAFVVEAPEGERVVLTERGTERPYRAMVDGMRQGAATVAVDGTILYTNRPLANMLGVPLERLVARDFLTFSDDDRRPALRAALGHVGDADWCTDTILRAYDGAEVPVRLCVTPLHLEGEHRVLALLVTDLRERRRLEAVAAAGQLAERIFDQASEAIVVCDALGRIHQLNRFAARLCNGRDERGRPFTEAFALTFEIEGFTSADLFAGRFDRVPARLARADGERYLRVSTSQVAGPDLEPFGTVVTLTDLTDLRRATERLERHAVRQRRTAELGRLALGGVTLLELARACTTALTEEIPDAMVAVTGALTAVNAAPENGALTATAAGVRRSVHAHGVAFGDLVVEPGEDRSLTLEDVGFVDNLVGLLCLAAEQQVLQEKLSHQAHHDHLTALPNRALLEDRLQQALARATRDGTMVAVLFIDLDRFKLINDSLGHPAGNEVLVQVAQRLAARLRESDTVSRLGGDEFVLVHDGLQHLEDAAEVARAVTATLSRPFHVAGHTVSVRATVGISVFPRDGHDTETLITRADKAMYYGKRGGRNTVQHFSGAMDAFTAAQLEMEHDLQAAVKNGQLELHFQALSCPRTGQLKGLEALSRWRHPHQGWIPPARFVPLAEEMGLVVDLGSWALGEACRQAARWTGPHDRDLRVSVNISPNHFARPDFLASVRAALDGSGLAPRHLELEVTESIMMHDVATVTRVLNALRGLGVQIALDDFGLGYSSVSYLRRLPLDRLKIDKSFLEISPEPLDTRHDQVAVLAAIGTMAQALGLQVTLEGVETPHHLRLARGMGCDEVQGHLFGGAVPADAVFGLIERWPHRSWQG